MYPVLTQQQMRQWEKDSWQAGIKSDDVIQNVGGKIAQILKGIIEERKCGKLLVLAGGGHNGDDALAAVERLGSMIAVKVLRVSDPRKGLEELESILYSADFYPDIILDGVFGIGLNRPLDAHWIEFIQAINELNVIQKISIDVPSGLNKEGRMFPVAIEADLVLTVAAPKTCLLTEEGVRCAKEVIVIPEIGLIPCNQKGSLNLATEDDFRSLFPEPSINTHKGEGGHLLILAGSLGYHGAAVLAARAACAGRPGLITVCTMPDVYIQVASQLQVQMVHPWREGWEMPRNITSILVGPGLAAKSIPEKYRSWVCDLWQNWGGIMVADASALDWIPGGSCAGKRVITPHPGEAARCLGVTAKEIQDNRLESLQKLSAKYGEATVVLKGHQTLVGSKAEKVFINTEDTPWLAQGGTGDVLAGFIGGLLAHPNVEETLSLRCLYGVHRHGLAGKVLSSNGVYSSKCKVEYPRWTALDLIKEL